MRCQVGDLCIVLKSVDNASVGMIVQVSEFLGEHSVHGPIWRCRSKGTLVTEYGGVGHVGDFADDWLEPIRPPSVITQQEAHLTRENSTNLA
jgi:hypothetical protein